MPSYPELTNSILRPDKHRLLFLASPYTLYSMGRERAFCDVSVIAAELALAGYKIYSPVMHGHPMSAHGRVPAVRHAWWREFNSTMVDICDALLIVMMEGWKRSAGVQGELKDFKEAGKPYYFLTPYNMKITQDAGQG